MKVAALLAFVAPLSLSFVGCNSGAGGSAAAGGHSATGGSQAGPAGNSNIGGTAGGSAGGVAPSGGAGGNVGSDAGALGGNGESSEAGADGAPGGVGGGVGGHGGQSGSAGAGMSGNTTFNPCRPAGTECKIMPLGDSITLGSHSSGGGYRVELFRQSLMDAKKITFVGRNSNGPATVAVNGSSTTFPQSHEGYSAYTIDINPISSRTGSISSIVGPALKVGTPHIVLLMIGTNDVNDDLDLANAPLRLGNLLDRITTMAPNALLVVAKITPTQTDATNTKVRSYNTAITGLVQTRTAAGRHIAVVDMYAAITANANYKAAWLDDDLHPNDAGYVVLGQTWYAGIKPYLR